MFGELILLELMLILAAGLSLIWGYKGMLISWMLISLINYGYNHPEGFWFWEGLISSYTFLGVLINTYLGTITKNLRVLKVTAGSGGALITTAIFLPLFPAFLLWTVFLGIPLIFTYREISKAVPLQIFFKFIFSAGWLMIGNIL